MEITSSSGVFTSLCYIDWTAQSSQNLKGSGDGTYTAAGFTWTVSGSAKTGTLDILNNTGLRIIRNASGGTPRIETNLLAVAPLAKVFRGPLVLWFRIINNSTAVSNAWTYTHIFNAGIGSLIHDSGRLNSTGTALWRTFNQGQGSHTLDTTTNLTDDVNVGVIRGQDRCEYYSGLYSNGWPTWSSLTPRGVALFNSGDLSSTFFDTGNNGTKSVAFGVVADDVAGGSAAASLTWTHFLIEGMLS